MIRLLSKFPESIDNRSFLTAFCESLSAHSTTNDVVNPRQPQMKWKRSTVLSKIHFSDFYVAFDCENLLFHPTFNRQTFDYPT